MNKPIEKVLAEKPTQSVYQAINAVQADLASVGIAKDHRNGQGSGYNFRGIDDVYNVLARLLAKHGLCILPRMISRTCEERAARSGGALFYVTVEAEFDLVSASDGSMHTIKTFGEAMDSGDKATNKAMSAAYKYAAFQAFSIPTKGDNDADATTHEPLASPEVIYKALNEAARKGMKSLAAACKAYTAEQLNSLDLKRLADIRAAAEAMEGAKANG